MILKYGFEYYGRPFLFDCVCRGGTPLHSASQWCPSSSAASQLHGKVATCEILLKNGADVNAKDDMYYPSKLC
jgi:hypothetical protein